MRHGPSTGRLAMLPGTPQNLYDPAGPPPVDPNPPDTSQSANLWTGGPWNTKINWVSAQIGGSGRTFAQWVGSLGYAYVNTGPLTGNDAPMNVWHAHNSDPVWSLTGMFNGNVNVGGTARLNIPSGFDVPFASADQNANVWNLDTGYHYDFYGVTNINNTNHTANVQAIWQLHQSQDGWGTGVWPNGQKRGSRAAGCQFGGGEISADDWRNKIIDHALGFAASRSNWSQTPRLPAVYQDSGWQSSYTGTVPLGTLFAIPPTSRGGPTKPAGLSTIGSMVWDACRDYGTYPVDSTGSFTWYADAGDDYVDPSWVNDLRWNAQDGNKILVQLKMITQGKPSLSNHA